MYFINSCSFSSFCLPDDDFVIDKSFPQYSTTPHRGIAQDMLFFCCREYVGIIGGQRVSPLRCLKIKFNIALLFIRTSILKFRLVVLNFLEILKLNCS